MQQDNWQNKDTDRFAELRLQALDQPLSSSEQAELEELQNRFEAAETQQLAPAITKMMQERNEMAKRLQQVNSENTRLAYLLQEQKHLVNDAKRWIAEFETRHRVIYQQYTSLKHSGILPTV